MRVYIFIIGLILSSVYLVDAQDYPSLIFTKSGLDQIKSSDHPPLFQKAMKAAQTRVDHAISLGIDVPIPADLAGGYTHETHKGNYRNMQLAGALYLILKDDKYAEYIKSMLMQYASMFKNLPLHPTQRSYATGKVFWQCLNDANWLVYTSQAYDAIHNYLSESEIKYLDQELFRPYADFISIESPQFFNRVHNHSTWGNAAVGMIGLVMNDDELIERALYGLQLDDFDKLAKDNDGGYIYDDKKAKAGFFAQIDYAFSPDGYYNEGPYYQRYAMLPFMLFAQGLENKRPDLKIFEYRDGILIKGVKALIYQTNSKGEFFPINDAQKGMSILAESVITAVNVAYGASKDPDFIAAAAIQDMVELDQNGFNLARSIMSHDLESANRSSKELRDGEDGKSGALGILRSGSGKNEFSLVAKYTSQGLGHGHYDKLSYFVYDGSTEVLQDYGSARWVNINQKDGGGYLKENTSWAKQTVAHNTVVVDQKSHFNGDYKIAVDKHSDGVYFNTSHESIQVISAKESSAYDGVELQRNLLLWTDSEFSKPVVIDVFSILSDKEHSYDLPFQYAGQVMSHDFDFKMHELTIMGNDHGYQHLYQEASALTNSGQFQMNWFKDQNFYTLTSVANDQDSLLHARLGANDPNFNLRRDPLLIQRRTATNTTFLSIIESHGSYSPVSEIPIHPYGTISELKIVMDNQDYIIFDIISKDKIWQICLAKLDGNNQSKHIVLHGSQKFEWLGPVTIKAN